MDPGAARPSFAELLDAPARFTRSIRRTAFAHDVVWLDHNAGHHETLSGFNPQGPSQWDGFRHIRSRVHGFYNGFDEAHGVHH